MATMINYLLSFFWNTKAMDAVYGLFAMLSIFIIASLFHLPVLEKILYYLMSAAGFAVLVIFQPEIRLAFSKLTTRNFGYREVADFDRFLNGFSTLIYKFADRRIGALIVLENFDSLEQYVTSGVSIQGQFSPELLETIFIPTTPLHDGAVLLKDTKIISAATILPLPDDNGGLNKSMGTRHRAALSMSQRTDALVVVVSEETGKVSIAKDGIMTRGVKIDRFRSIIKSNFNPETTVKTKSFKWPL